MSSYLTKAFNTSFASRLFKLIVLLSIIPSLISLSVSIYYQYDTAISSQNKINQHQLKTIALAGLELIHNYRGQSLGLAEAFYDDKGLDIEQIIYSSPFTDFHYIDKEGLSILKGDSDIAAAASAKIWLLDHKYYERISDPAKRFEVIFSLPLVEVWRPSFLADKQIFCILPQETEAVPNHEICLNDGGIETWEKLDKSDVLSNQLASWNMFLPGYSQDSQLATSLQTSLDSQVDTPLSVVNFTALFYILSNLAFIFLLIQLLRSSTRPIDRIRDIQSSLPTLSSTEAKSELKSIGDSLLEMNSNLSERVAMLSAVRRLSEASLEEDKHLPEELVLGLLGMRSINACLYLELDDQANPKCLYLKSLASPLYIEKDRLDDKYEMLKSLVERGAIESSDMLEVSAGKVFEPNNSVLHLSLGSSKECFGLLFCELQKDLDEHEWEHIFDVVDYSKLAFKAKQREDELQYRANNDLLTGLLNRERMSELVDISLNRSNSVSAFIFIDLDNFKHINDTQGHEAGDRAIKLAAGVIKTCLAGRSALISRFGGDEFNIFLEGVRSKTEVVRLAELVLRNIEKHTAGLNAMVSASVGIVFSDDAGDSEDLMRCADIAMYSAKAKGKSQVAVYNKEQSQLARDRASLDDFVSRLDCKQDLNMVLQPKVNKSGKIIGFEALSRFRVPEGHQWNTFDIISHAEATGKILDLGTEILRKACLTLSNWKAEGVPLAVISVNVAPLQLQSPSFIDELTAVCREYDIDNAYIELEVTESELIETDGVAASSIAELHKRGFKLSLDDFGTGYSCFSYISDLPFGRLKVDKSLTENVSKSQKHRTILEAIIKMAKHMGMEVTVEGVETEEEKQLIYLLGADDIQGYVFSRPVPAEEAKLMLMKAKL